MASDRAERINYVQGHVPGTQSENTTPFCGGVTVISGAPNENIVQNHLNIALFNVF